MYDVKKWFRWVGMLCIGASLLLAVMIFSPILWQEAKFSARSVPKHQTLLVDMQDMQKGNLPNKQGTEDAEEYIIPESTEFGIVIPKIGANAPIVENVDPFDESEYRSALTRGVAQARGTDLPGQGGNMFLFAHSSDSFYRMGRYNVVFYLLHNLAYGDHIYVIYRGTTYDYIVTDSRKVSPETMGYLKSGHDSVNKEQITLMTCWPPGTAARRLLVFGTLSGVIEQNEISLQ